MIEKITTANSSVEVNNRHGSIELRFDADAKFQFTAKTKHGSIRNSMPNTTVQRKEVDNNEQVLEGKTNGGGNAIVRVTNQHGSIRLEER